MKKIIAFGASNSKNSINKQLAFWAAGQLEGVEVQELDLNDFELPIYNIDYENEYGIAENAQKFKDLVDSSDGIIVSFAENNGSFTVAFKNVYDWISRIGTPIWGDKPMMLMATSPGKRGGSSVLKHAQEILPFRGAKISGVFSLPSFGENFEDGIANEELRKEFDEQLKLFASTL